MASQRRVVFELRWGEPGGPLHTEWWWRRRHAERRRAELSATGHVVRVRTTRNKDLAAVLFAGRHLQECTHGTV